MRSFAVARRRARRGAATPPSPSGDTAAAASPSAHADYRDRAPHRRRRLRRRQGHARRGALERSRRRGARGRARTRSSPASRRPMSGSLALGDRCDHARTARRLRPRADAAGDRAKPRRRPQRLEADAARHARRSCSTTAPAPSSAAATASLRRWRRAISRPTRCLPARRGRWLLVAGTIRFTTAAPPDAWRRARTAACHRGRDRARATAAIPRRPPASREARKTVRFVADGSLHIDAVAADATAGVGRPRRLGRYRRPLSRLALRRHAARRRPLVGPQSRSSPTAGRSAPARGDRRVCRYAAAARRDRCEHRASGDDADVGAALLGRNFLVVRGSDELPGRIASPNRPPEQTDAEPRNR